MSNFDLKEGNFMRTQAAAEFLGTNVKGVYNMVQRGLIPSYKLGKSLYFDANELQRLIASKRRKTAEEMEQY